MPRNQSRQPRQLRMLPAALAASLLAGALAIGDPHSMGTAVALTGAGQVPSSPTADSLGAVRGVEITLITGDTVAYSVTSDGRAAVTIPESSASSAWSGQTGSDGYYLVPSVAAPYIGAGLVDREFFNLTYLAENGYDDSRMPTLPVIVEASAQGLAGSAGQRADALPAAATTRILESIGAAGVAIDKSAADQFWATLTRTANPAGSQALGGQGLGGGVSKLWLDRKVEATLDESIPQIGAQHAWAAGLDGSGVTVAMLDTGIDTGHGDFTGKIAATANFTTEESVTDGNGHGTHVASTIAGTGAASGGQYTGVAPGANLLVGKVLDSTGEGFTSWVIDGMEWAAAEGADVVNMSIGGGPSDGSDAMSRAVNRISTESGTLFVIAAGNAGPSRRTVSSPGAAAEALTVGAVDKQDQLADFSGRGPLVGTHALKPEITAPGVGIVAARAADGTDMDGNAEPVGEWYARASGTSMATPHVAGAAAILAQQHPGWDREDIKAALISTALPNESNTVYEQGGGRLDVGRAVSQMVHSDTATVNLGFFDWPHDGSDDLVTREVTYRNLADDEVTLDLHLTVSDENGDPLPAGALTADASDVTVAPGGTETVVLTLDPNAAGVGAHGGYLTATSGDVAVHTPLGFVKEGPMFHLTVEGIRGNGQPAAGFDSVQFFGLGEDNVFGEQRYSGGATTFRLPPGDYSVMSYLGVVSDGYLQESEQAVVGNPEFRLTGDHTLTLDARDAVEIEPVTPRKTEPRGLRLGYLRSVGDRSVSSFLASSTATRAFTAPTAAVSTGGFEFYSRWTLLAPDLVVEVVVPEQYELRQAYMVGSPLLDGHHRRQLVDGGIGRPEDLDSGQVAGNAVLIRRSTLSFADQAQNAAAAGASLAIIFNDRPGRLNASVGSPSIPVLAISQEPGEQLRDLIADGDVQLELNGIAISPYSYDLVIPHEDRIPDALVYDVGQLDLAVLQTAYHSQLPDQVRGVTRTGWRPYETFSADFARRLPAPFVRTEYISANDTRWRADVYASYPFTGRISEPLVAYEPGERLSVSWFKQPVRPTVREATAADPGSPVVRDRDALVLDVMEFGDAEPEHYGPPTGGDATAFRLFRDGQLVAEGPRAVGQFEVPATRADYRVELDVERNQPWWPLATRTHTAWTFASERPAGDESQLLPMLLVDYDIPLGLRNDLTKPGTSWLGLDVRHQRGADAAPVAGVQVWFSSDDGQTWSQAKVKRQENGGFRAKYQRHPHSEGYVSIKVRAWDGDGNGIEQQIIRAFAINPGGPRSALP